MAKLRAFSVLDLKLSEFSPPMFLAHLGQAVRTWEEIANDPSSNICKYPSDFILYEVGSFDQDKGILEALVPPSQVATALEARRKPDPRQMQLPV